MKQFLSRLSVPAIALLLIVSLAACGTSVVNKPDAPETEENITASTADTDVSEKNTTVKPAGLTEYYEAYRKEVNRVYAQNAYEENEYGETGRNADLTEFYLYDLNADGVPELMIDHGYKTNTMDEGVSVYTYTPEKGLIHLGNTEALGTFFTDEKPGDGEFGMICFYHDHTAQYKYRIEGETLKETVVEDWRDAVITDDSSEYLETEERVRPILIVEPDGWYSASEADAVFAGF